MANRCPKAKPIGKFVLKDAKLIFRGVADCVYEEGAECQGGLWKITEECEESLDIYEGFTADNNGSYRKIYVPLETVEGQTGHDLMLYVMNSTGIFPPSEYYLDSIKQGYRDFGLPLKPLHAAVSASHADKHPSHIERRRYRKAGRPTLACVPF
jgi:hypothetical protein